MLAGRLRAIAGSGISFDDADIARLPELRVKVDGRILTAFEAGRELAEESSDERQRARF